MSDYSYYGDRQHNPYHERFEKPKYMRHTSRVGRDSGPLLSRLDHEPRDDNTDSDDGYYSDNYHRPKRRHRNSIADRVKSFGEDLGVGGVVAAVTGQSDSRAEHRSDQHSRRRARSYDDDWRSLSRSRSSKQWKHAAKAAAVAGAVEAYRSLNDPGPWTGAKGARVATAALGAAAVDGFRNKDPDKHSKRHTAESALVGLIGNRIAGGPHPRF